jgi:hypothetical protein
VVPDANVKIVSLRNNVLPGTEGASVQISGQSLATLTASGQYLPAPRSQLTSLDLGLEKVGGQWRISQLPTPTSLIITQAAYQRDYVPRNLYFYGPSGSQADSQSGVLVPDPVFVPQQAPGGPATVLLDGLLQAPIGWLAGATTTSFPPNTQVLGVSVTATSAIVDLGGAAADASRQVLKQMAAQIVWTLTSSSYSSAAISSVQLRINQRPVTQLLLQQKYVKSMPARSGPMYYIGRNGKPSVLGSSAQATRVSWPVSVPVTKIAVAPTGEIAGIVPRRDGCEVYAAQPNRSAPVSSWALRGGSCMSLSSDDAGDIWATAGSHVWYLPEEGSAAVPVPTQGVPAGDTLTDLRVAPDGVRVAMIAQGRSGPARVLLGAETTASGPAAQEQLTIGQQQYGLQTIGPGITDPVALAWYDADHILVLSGAGSRQLYEVPLNGGAAIQIVTPPGVVSVATAGSEAGPGSQLFVGTGSGEILKSQGPGAEWQKAAIGTMPVFAG